MSLASSAAQLWAKADRSAVRAFFLSLAALTISLLLALYSGTAAEAGHLGLAAASALGALLVAAWVAITLVPVLAKRTALRWIGYRMEYKVSREGWIYILGIFLVAIAALNTGNNLLFLILACLIAIILMSGILSSITLSGVEMRLELPEHIFAGQPVRGVVEVHNEKETLPSFSLRVEGVREKTSGTAAMLETPIYFPFIPKHESAHQSVPMTFPRRGVYRQEAFRIVTRFPFGFLQKARRVDLQSEALVYPSVEPTTDFLEILPSMEGALETHLKGGGQDLHALRDYLPRDSSRHVHWKVSARLGTLMVREFTREEDCRVVLVFDAHMPADLPTKESEARFERAVSMCAALAWHFYERNATLQFRTAGFETPLVEASEVIFDILRNLATAKPLPPDPQRALLTSLSETSELYRIIVTSEPHGSIPAHIWNQSWVLFLEDLSH
ncbi:MAG TPA: DUF58 domain-containing protein [Candidatus Methylomirabilis sp.]|nr:DUF58 domain-containing protein [Candidatus Methylomirabilis sp.]